MVVKEDPHHGGDSLWCLYGDKLYHKNKNESEWDEVSRVSYTLERMKMITELIEEANNEGK